MASALVLALLPATAMAAPVITNYVDEHGAAHTAEATAVTSSDTTLSSGWYVVDSNVTTTNLAVSGNVNLILADGFTLTAVGSGGRAGVCVSASNSLTIWGQSGGTGALNATGGSNGAGIGGNSAETGGSLTVNGGNITANGGEHGAGIGGGGNSGNIGGAGGTVVIHGGTVVANGNYAAGIGNASYCDGGTTVTITGGTVTASSNLFGAGIGGGFSGDGGTVTITGGTVTATGASTPDTGGAGFGGGGGGSAGDGGTVTITGGTITAAGGNGAAGIGGGSRTTPDLKYGGRGSCDITGGTVKIGTSGYSNDALPTNGIANGNNRVYLTTVALSDVSAATAVTSLTTDAGYIYGTSDMKTDAAGKLYLYLPENTRTTAAATASTAYEGTVTTTTTAETSLGTLSPKIADLAITITDGVVTAIPGEAVTYTITATNSGPSNVSGATVSCTFPDALTNVTWRASVAGGPLTDPVSGNINDTVNLPAGASVTYTVMASISSSASGTLSTTATVSPPAGVTDLTPGNNLATDTDTLLSTDASLSSLSLSQGTLSPTFSSSTYAYAASVANNVSSLTVTPTVRNANANVNVNGTAVSSGNASGNIALAVGTNTITLLVTAQDSTTLTYTLTVTREARSGRDYTSPGYTAGVSGGGSLPITVNVGTNTASVNVDAQMGGLMAGGANKTIKMPSIPGVSSYSLGVPVAYLTTSSGGSLTFGTNTGSITLPADMLAGVPGASGKAAQINIGKGDKTALSTEAQSKIGNRPIIQLSLTLDGVKTEWNNPNAPVSISIPYQPTPEELANPDSIVIWNIDGSGELICISNGHYEAATGTVTFETTHFSFYAVGYHPVRFDDVAAGAWYYDAVSFVAARGITTGTGNGNFSPNEKLTRGEFIVMLMRAYGIIEDTNVADNFTDAGSAYYTGYLATAKRLGISNGVGNNLFAPEKQITRQEMFTLLYHTLKSIGSLPEGTSSKTLSDFSDSGEIADWAKNAMMLLVETGTVTGSSDKLSPSDTTTRAEMAQVLYRLLGK